MYRSSAEKRLGFCADPSSAGCAASNPLGGRAAQIDPWRTPLPLLASPLHRLLLRSIGAIARRQVRSVTGIESILPERDPFLLVANHDSRREAVLLPASLMLLRGGRPVRFLADWNFRLIRGIGWLYDATCTITVARKPARPVYGVVLRTPRVKPGPYDRASGASKTLSQGLDPESCRGTPEHAEPVLRRRQGSGPSCY